MAHMPLVTLCFMTIFLQQYNISSKDLEGEFVCQFLVKPFQKDFTIVRHVPKLLL